MGDTKRLVSNTAIIFVGSSIASVFSYLFNMLMGRLLGPAQYGEMAAILSLLSILSVISGVITTITMLYVSELYGLGNLAGIKRLLKLLSRYVFFLAILFFLVGTALARPIASFFSISHIVPVVIAFSSFIFGFIIVVNKGILQGTQRFVSLTIIGVIEMILRVVLGIILVKIGLAVSGAILATVLATIAAYFITFLPINKLLGQIKNSQTAKFHFDKKDIITYSAPVFLSTLLLATLLNLDVLLVKHYFSLKDAGLYAAVSTVAKIILYLTAPIISVMFPMILEKKSKGEKHFKMLFFSLGLTVVGALLILTLYTVAPGFMIQILYGKNYTELYYLLPQLSIFILFYTLINLLANYYLAVKNFVFLIFMTLVVLLIFGWTSFFHPSISAVIRIFIVSSGLLFFLMIGYYFYIKKHQIILFLKGEHE